MGQRGISQNAGVLVVPVPINVIVTIALTTDLHENVLYLVGPFSLSVYISIWCHWNYLYRLISNISCTLVYNKTVDHSDVVGASAVGCRIKTGSGGVCCHNARGRVRNRKSNPDGVAAGI